MLRTFGVAREHNAALIGMVVNPLARSDRAIENMNSAVRSSRSCGYLVITTITRTFSVIFVTISTLSATVLISSNSIMAMSK